jgi:hypothetical protein
MLFQAATFAVSERSAGNVPPQIPNRSSAAKA